MFRFDRLVLTVMLVGVAAVAWGAVNKIGTLAVKDTIRNCVGECSDTGTLCTAAFPCPNGATCEGAGDQVPLEMHADADGMAILNYVSGTNKTVVQVIVSDFTGAPLDRFIVRLNPGNGFDLGSFVVDSQGNGNFHGEVSGDYSASTLELYQQVDGPPCPAVLIASGG